MPFTPAPFPRLLLNLLSNAVKFNRPRGIVRVRLASEEETWTLDIANTGLGIAAEHQVKIFERFFRAGISAATPSHGLGLSLSRELARAHGGDLALAASDTAWTTFRLTLPRPPFEPELSVAPLPERITHAAAAAAARISPVSSS